MSVSHAILPGMPVLSAQNTRVGTVDGLEGTNLIKLTKDEQGQHHYIPKDWVASTDNAEVKLSCDEKRAQSEWLTQPNG